MCFDSEIGLGYCTCTGKIDNGGRVSADLCINKKQNENKTFKTNYLRISRMIIYETFEEEQSCVLLRSNLIKY